MFEAIIGLFGLIMLLGFVGVDKLCDIMLFGYGLVVCLFIVWCLELCLVVGWLGWVGMAGCLGSWVCWLV